MKQSILTIFFITIFYSAFPQRNQIVETKDIDHFWIAFDKLESAKTKNDSIEIIKSYYIDQSTKYFKEFIKLRNFKAEEYVNLINKYPKFWKSIRKDTKNVKKKINDLNKILDAYEKEFPNFKRPDICFAIGCLRTGGTISENLILVGTELAVSTSETDPSELSPWLQSVIGKFEAIDAIISHEMIHIQQKNKLKTLAEFAINEGVADFLSNNIGGVKINKPYFTYGQEHDCELKNEFLKDYSNNKTDFSNWLFNGQNSIGRPADLGYYIGYKIAEEYYKNSLDKKKAVLKLLDRKNYLSIFRKSEYIKKRCL